MITTSGMNINDLIKKEYAIQPIRSADYDNLVILWRDWYKGKHSTFHDVNVSSGVINYSDRIKQMNMGKKIAEARADLIMNEKVRINIDERLQEEFEATLNENNFWVMGNRSVETAAALGSAAWVIYEKNKKVSIDYIDPEMIYPLSVYNGKITECAFASVFYEKGKSYVYLCAHFLEGDGYRIENKYYEVLNNSIGKQVPAENFKVAPVVNVSQKRFFIVSPNIANNLIDGSPLGISRYANSIDTLEVLDIIFDSLDKEFILGRKRIMVGSETLAYDGKNPIPTFNLREKIFNVFSLSGNENKSLIQEIDMKLRTGDHVGAIELCLNMLSSACGLGVDYFSWTKNGGVRTTTEVISANSDLYRSVQKDENLLEIELKGLINAIYEIKGWSIDTEIKIIWDDSIIQDENARRTDLLREVQNGIRSPISYLMEVYNMTAEDAALILPTSDVNAFLETVKKAMSEKPLPDDETEIEKEDEIKTDDSLIIE